MPENLSSFFLLALPFFYSYGQHPDERQVEDMISFAKLYGYTRYLHPSDKAAEINWEKFVQYAVSVVNVAEGKK
jgi:hypothetical protein